MASAQEAIQRLRYEFTSDGADRVVSDVNKVGAAVVTSSTTQNAAQLSLDKSFAGMERRYIDAIRNQQDYQKTQDRVNAAVQQNPALQERANAVLAAAAQRYGQINDNMTLGQRAAKGFQDATSGVSGQLIALSAGAGPVGVFLSAFGPWGIAAAVGIGSLAAAFGYVREEAERMGQKAIALQQFKEVTGLTAAQIGALKQSASELGVSGDEVQSAFQRATGQLNDARRASGQLYGDLRLLGGGLADDLQKTTTTSQAIDVLARAYKASGDEAQKAAIARAVFGRAGAALGPVLGGVADAGGIAAMAKATQNLGEETDDQVKRWAKMQSQIDDMNNRAKNILAKIFTQEGLEASLKAAELSERTAKAIAEIARQREGLSWWQKFWADVTQGVVGESGGDVQGFADSIAKIAATQRVAQQLSAGKTFSADQNSINSWNQFGEAVRGVQGPLTGAAHTVITLKQAQDDAAASAKQLADRNAALGPAATIYQQAEARLAKIESDRLDNLYSSNKAENDALAIRARSVAELDTQAQKSSAVTSALGPMATIQEMVRASQDKLNQEIAKGAPLTEAQIAGRRRLIQAQADGTFQLQAEIDATKVQTATIGLSVGAAETYQLIQTKINENLNAGRPALDGVSAGFIKLAGAAGVAKQAQAELKAQNDATFNLQTAFFTETERQVADLQRSLHGNDWQSFMNDGLAAQTRLAAGFKQLNDAAGTFASGFIKDIDNGVAPMQALAAQAKNLAQNLIDIASKQVASNLLGSLLGNLGQGASQTTATTTAAGIWTAAGETFNAALIASATAAAGILAGGGAAAGAENAEGGAVAGTETATGGATAAASLVEGGTAAGTAIWGPLAAVVAAIAAAGALVYGLTKGRSQSDIRAQQKADTDARNLLAQLNGSGGSLSTQVAGLNSQTNSAVIALGGKNQALAWQLINSTNDAITKAQSDFIAGWKGTIDALKAGLGDNSPFSQARSNVEQLAKSIKDFVDNTQFAADHGGAPTGNSSTSVSEAQQAGQQALLSMIQMRPQLSDVQQKLQTIKGTSSALADALTQLGMSSADAAAAINDGVNKAIGNLKTGFESSLTQRLNIANNQGFLNDISSLITQNAQDLADAASVGASTALVNSVFAAEAQKIVNDAQLTGDAFQHLITLFPQLAGVVTEFSSATQTAVTNVARSAQQLAQAGQSLSDRLFAATNDTSTLAGQLAAFDRQAEQERLAEIQAGGELINQLEETLSAERLQIIERFNEQALQQQQQALQEAENFLQGVTRQIKDWLAGLQAGASSPLSPHDRLASAQSSYNSQLALAQGGNRDALNSITQYAQSLIDAAKGYYGSSTGFQTIFSLIKTQLTALPSQVSPEQLIVNALQDQTTALQNAINTGSASAIASALLPMFNSLDTNVDGLLSPAEFTSGLHGMASDSALAQMFKTLDTDNSGSLSRMELTNQALGTVNTALNTSNTNTQSTAQNSSQTAQNVNQVGGKIDTTNTNTANTSQHAQDTSSNVFDGNKLIDAIKATSADMQNYLQHNINVNLDGIYRQTQHYLDTDSNLFLAQTFANGGLVSGGVRGADSVRAILMPGEWVNTTATVSRLGSDFFQQLDAGRVPAIPVPFGGGYANDNSALLRELQELRREVAALRSDNNIATLRAAERIGAAVTESGESSRAELAEVKKRLSRNRAAAA